jgi:hypothetical protein
MLLFVIDSDADTDPDTDTSDDGNRHEDRGGDVPVAVTDPSSGR